MPTRRPRHFITEADELTAAIDAAALLHPGESRAAILRHVIRGGTEAIAERQAHHRSGVHERAGQYPAVYATRYLDDLREEWPD